MSRNYSIVALIFVIFFVISFLTNIIGPLIPEIIKDFELSLSMAAFLPFAFFVAYGVMSVPVGIILERYGEKTIMLAAFFLAFLGAALFSFIPQYSVAILSLFLIGAGMAALQVAINPLLRVAGGESSFAFFSVMAQVVFGLASYLSPLVYSYLVTNLKGDVSTSDWIIKSLSSFIPQDLPWVSLYVIFAITSLLMVVLIGAVRLPKVELKEDEQAGSKDVYKDLIGNKTVWLFFFAIFAYVGVEQGIANWMSKFLESYHGIDPQTVGAQTISAFWGWLLIGCLVGLVLLKLLDSRLVLKLFSSLAIILLAVALNSSGEIAIIIFPMLGFSIAVMWSVIFSLALNSVKEHHGSFSGILCTGIVGGAVLPLIVGNLGDWFGLQIGMYFLFIPLAYILSVGFWAKPLVTNKTISWGSKKTAETV